MTVQRLDNPVSQDEARSGEVREILNSWADAINLLIAQFGQSDAAGLLGGEPFQTMMFGRRFVLASDNVNGLDPVGQPEYLICYTYDKPRGGDATIGKKAWSIARDMDRRQPLYDGESFDKNTTATTETLSYFYDTTRGAYTVSGPNERIVEDGNTPVGRHVQVIVPSYDNVNTPFRIIKAGLVIGGDMPLGHDGKPCMFEELGPSRIWSMDNNRAGA